jgi:hypothetical protein
VRPFNPGVGRHLHFQQANKEECMRAYVVTTGVLYVALFLAHVARLVFEGSSPLRSPTFILTSLGSLVMVAWSVRVVRSGAARSVGPTNAA